ncbi:MAG: transglycosylase domain-containing protein [Hyphomicrobiales bacterium]|nr:transglycosylase domain-containing protein [Hyphomicrobiales bacterium]
MTTSSLLRLSRDDVTRRVAVALAAAGVCAVVALSVVAFSRAKLEAPQPTALVYDRNGAFITQVSFAREESRRADFGYWPLQGAPDRIARATLALEDRHFADHPGVDPQAVLRALWKNARGRTKRSGASTIAMQIARMQHPAPRTLLNKTLEGATAIALTLRYGRAALLAHYLRLTPYGNGSHGIAHAARYYFDKPVADLSWAEIALLSAVPQSPTRMNLLRPEGLNRAIRRGQRALDELARQGVIGPVELAEARRRLSRIQTPAALRRPDDPHVALLYERLVRDGKLAPSNACDPRIHATIDLRLQARAKQLARKLIGPWRGAGAEQAAILIVQRGSRDVLARVGSIDYDRNAGAYDFTNVQRSPGSTLKPFLYALALERGVIRPTDIMADLPEGASGVNNADGAFLGPLLPRQALANSRNVPATNLLKQVGLETAFRFLHDIGVHNVEAPAENFGLSMAIGSLPTKLDNLVRAYSALAEDGRLGDLVYAREQTKRDEVRVLSVDSARLVASFLSDPLARLPSFPRYGATEYPYVVALKTGTSQGYRDAWIVAFSQKVVIGVWVGRGDSGTMRNVSGGTAPARIAHAILNEIQGVKAGDIQDGRFPAPPGRVPVEICATSGRLSTGDCGQTLVEWVRPNEMPAVAAASSPTMPSLRSWAREEGWRVAAPSREADDVRLVVSTPENNSRIWSNPEQPANLNRLVLKARVEPRVEQIVWYVDGEPFAITDPDKPVYWPMRQGSHRFQARLPLQAAKSRPVRVTIE